VTQRELPPTVERLLLDRFEDYAGRETLLFRSIFEEKLHQHGTEFHTILGRNLSAEDIQQAVETPDTVCRSLHDPQVVFYYKRLTERFYLRVVVVEATDPQKLNSIISFHPRTSVVGFPLWQEQP